MARLKDRNRFIPGGFFYTQAILNYETQGVGYKSFYVVRDEIVTVRRANPFLSQQHNLSTDPEVVANELDTFCAARMQARGWTNFITESTGPPLSQPHSRLRSAVAAVGQGIKRTAAGIKTVASWLGAGLRPVDKQLATKRAEVCVACPLNGEPNFIESLSAAAADELKALMGIKNDLALETPYDSKLMTCKACGCTNSLKVWANLDHIAKELTEETKAALDVRCWILSELNAKLEMSVRPPASPQV